MTSDWTLYTCPAVLAVSSGTDHSTAASDAPDAATVGWEDDLNERKQTDQGKQ